MVFCIRPEIIDVNGGQAGYEELQFLLVEDGYEALGNDVIEALEEGIQSGKIQRDVK